MKERQRKEERKKERERKRKREREKEREKEGEKEKERERKRDDTLEDINHTSSGVALVDGLTYTKHTYKNMSFDCGYTNDIDHKQHDICTPVSYTALRSSRHICR